MSPDSTRLSHQSYFPKEVLYCYKFLKIETSRHDIAEIKPWVVVDIL